MIPNNLKKHKREQHYNRGEYIGPGRMPRIEQSFSCDECLVSYRSQELLDRHRRKHQAKQLYKCDHCDYTAKDMYKIRRHQTKHTGEKPYVCDICYRGFTQASSLKSHKQIHFGSRPTVKCNKCCSTFGRAADLNTHMKRQHSTQSSQEVCQLLIT